MPAGVLAGQTAGGVRVVLEFSFVTFLCFKTKKSKGARIIQIQNILKPQPHFKQITFSIIIICCQVQLHTIFSFALNAD
ncbi:hypothetical protein BH10BAC2_BH10BAC2_41060 [soil metagenome]